MSVPVFQVDAFADGFVAELVVEGGYARDRRRRDVCQIADSPQCLGGQVAVLVLQALQDGDHGFATASHLRDDAFDMG